MIERKKEKSAKERLIKQTEKEYLVRWLQHDTGTSIDNQKARSFFKKNTFKVSEVTFRHEYFFAKITLVQWLWVTSHVREVVGSNPGAVYLMDIFPLICIVCLKRPKINEKEAGVCPFKKHFLMHKVFLNWPIPGLFIFYFHTF